MELEITNPHWFDEKDEDIEKWESKKIKIVPKWLKEISLKPFSLNFVLGPRRVGKTTGLKLLIKNLIENEIYKPREIVYINADLIPNLKIFQNVLKFVSEEKFRIIIIDEATSIEDWWRPLKGFIDAGAFKNKVIIASGSLSLKIKKHAELFPGRRGYGKNIEVLPLNFREFFEIFNKKPKEVEIKNLFKKYLLTGGFLGALENRRSFIKELIDAFESEILKLKLSTQLSFEILSSLLPKLPSALSYQTIASEIGIDYKTVRSYLETFENMYILKIAYWKDNNKISFRKEKKLFFRDPLILTSFSLWTGKNFLESALFEGIVQEHLFRKYGEIYYFKNRFEIDCIAGDLKIEVKAGKPHRKYPKDVLILDEENIPKFLLELYEK